MMAYKLARLDPFVDIACFESFRRIEKEFTFEVDARCPAGQLDFIIGLLMRGFRIPLESLSGIVVNHASFILAFGTRRSDAGGG